MRLKRQLIAAVLAGSIGFIASSAHAANSVSVSRVPFPVELNGVTIDNEKTRYPLLLYRDVTYVPMTWEYGQALALIVSWSQENGLAIIKSAPKGIAVNPESSSKAEKPTHATIPMFPVSVNGKTIDNSSEPYPLLVYEDITYFPLTWKFAHDEFEWEVNWDSSGGLRIGTDQVQILHNIIYDDDRYLYLDTTTAGLLKISKDLQHDPAALNEAEAASIKELAPQASGAIILPFEADAGKNIEREGNLIRYHGIDLMDLEALKSAGHPVISKALHIGNGMDLVVVGARKDSENSEKWWTLLPEYRYFIVKDRAAKQIPGMTQSPTRIIRSSDGSVWLVSDSNFGTWRPANPYSQIALIEANGDIHGLNAEFNAFDIEITALQNNKLMIRSSNNRFSPTMVKEKDGFYSVDTSFSVKKLADHIAYSAYEDRNGNTYVVDKKNKISLTNSTRSGRWFDYVLNHLFIDLSAP
ncbi:hypothetical protein [Paenibacillus piri]|uniref:Copper amine oxidase-like N-terminal domain-containing protein n=1 Tax=Paenibacillus piri TaxID=2547395 RepID=A0A4R5KVW1_9BACL|nr:hypothetical protein [Paenibacillus piri]TDG00114.1 hypothetical protein E1757_00210 [Paenibacillus piri]